MKTTGPTPWSSANPRSTTTSPSATTPPDLDEGTRKRIALQFLYGLNFIHFGGHFHRDLSTRNVLLKVYNKGAVMVKLSDFGLAKERGSDFTLTETEMKGTKQDPALESFKNFSAVNDIYSAGFVLHYIFSGRTNLSHEDTEKGRIVHRCVDAVPSRRYQSVLELIADVEALEVGPTRPILRP